MKKLLQALLLLPLFVFGACGGGADSGGANASKPVNSLWILESNDANIQNGLTLDLRNMKLNTLYNKVESNGDGFSFITAGGPYAGAFGLVLGRGCTLISNDISCLELVRTNGSYRVSDNNKLTIHTTAASTWDGYVSRTLDIDMTEIYR